MGAEGVEGDMVKVKKNSSLIAAGSPGTRQANPDAYRSRAKTSLIFLSLVSVTGAPWSNQPVQKGYEKL